MTTDPVAAEILETIDGDRDDVVALCLALGNMRDYPGEEREVAGAVVAWLEDAGIEAWLQHLSEHSANAVGILRGTGDRASGARLWAAPIGPRPQGMDLVDDALWVNTQDGLFELDLEIEPQIRAATGTAPRSTARSGAAEQFAEQIVEIRPEG